MTRSTVSAPPAHRQRGQSAYHSGLCAESNVARQLEHEGLDLLEMRWRGRGGEIDLILRDGAVIVFVEVKKARSFEAALTSLRAPQMRRIHAAASEYLATTPEGQLSEVRFDLALVDETGQVQVLQNAFGHF